MTPPVPETAHSPTLKQLRYLAALDRHRHFGRAASACAVTQSAFSSGIRDLERLLGVQLVDRSTQPIALTPAGEAARRAAEPVLAGVRRLVNAARMAADPASGPMRLGLIPTVAPFLLDRALTAWRRALPGLAPNLVEGLSDDLVAALRDGALDAALLALPYDVGGLAVHPVADDPLLAVMPDGHALAEGPEIAPRDLDGYPILRLADGHCLAGHALSACGDRAGADGPAPAASLPTLVAMTRAGLGVAILPGLAVDAGALAGGGLTARPIAGAPARALALVAREGCPRAPVHARMAESLGEALSTNGWKKARPVAEPRP